MRALWLAAALLTLALAFTVARPHQVRGPVLRDFEAYWSAGVAWAAGPEFDRKASLEVLIGSIAANVEERSRYNRDLIGQVGGKKFIHVNPFVCP